MNYKSLLLCVLIGASMQTAHGMQQDDNAKQNQNANNNSMDKEQLLEIVEKQSLAIARLTSKLDTLESVVERQGKKLNTIESAQRLIGQQLGTVERKVETRLSNKEQS